MFKIARLLMVPCLLLIPSLVQAREPKQDPRVAKAKTACGAGDVQLGVRLLAELYTATNDPIWVFNQGRCYHQNDQLPQALTRFKEFLRKSDSAPAEDVKDAQKFIAEIESELHKELQKNDAKPDGASTGAAGPKPTGTSAEDTPPSPTLEAPQAGAPPVAPAPVPPASPAVPAAPAESVAVAPLTATPPTSSPGRSLRVAGIACGGVGVASLATAIYFYTRATSLSDKVSTSDAPSPSDHKAGKTAQSMQWVFYGVGAAALATGSVLYYLGWQAADAGQTAAIAPMVGPGMAGISAQGAF